MNWNDTINKCNFTDMEEDHIYEYMEGGEARIDEGWKEINRMYNNSTYKDTEVFSAFHEDYKARNSYPNETSRQKLLDHTANFHKL